MPKFYIIFARKIFFSEFFLGGGYVLGAPHVPISYAYVGSAQVSAKTDAVQNLEVQLSESRKHFSGSCDDVSKLELEIRDLTLELSTLRAQRVSLLHGITVMYFTLSNIVDYMGLKMYGLHVGRIINDIEKLNLHYL